MANFPLRPRYKTYRGSKEHIRRAVDDFNGKANRIAEHVNRQVAADQLSSQQYMFATIARETGCTTDEVRSAISNGGYNGITFRVTAEDRYALAPHLKSGL